MSFLHRYLSEDKTYEDSLCKLVDCAQELKTQGSCSSNCLDECPSFCKIFVVSPPQVIHHEDNLKRIAIIAATSIITTLFLLTLVIFCFIFYRKRRSVTVSRRWSIEEANEQSPSIIDHPVWNIRTIGLNPTVISSIKVCKYSKTDGVVEGTDCSVCLSEFEEEETLRLLPKCRHAFHLSCIDTWLRSHTNCPLCRAPIVVKDDDSEVIEETRVSVPEEDGEIDEDLEEEEEEEEERDEFVSKISTRDLELQQRVTRSMSLDSLSGRGKEKVKRSNTGSSIVGRSSFLNRSVSYNCK